MAGAEEAAASALEAVDGATEAGAPSTGRGKSLSLNRGGRGDGVAGPLESSA